MATYRTKSAGVEGLPLFDACRNRHGGDACSDAAHESLINHKDAQLKVCYDFIRDRGTYGATADEISEATGMLYATVSARCSWLRKNNKVLKNGTRLTRSGRSAAVLFVPFGWEL